VNDDGASGLDALNPLDGLLAWTQARYFARTAASPLRPTTARLDEAHGAILARAVTSP
jgi:hypothetical protein